MACSVRETITRELTKHQLIDDKNNIIGNTEIVFPYITALNKIGREQFLVNQDVLETYNVKSVAGTFTKIRFNEDIVQQIDSFRGVDNSEFESRYNRTTEDKIYTKPVGDNYIELLNWKNSEYKRNQIEVNKHRIALRSQSNMENKRRLEKQLRYLEEEGVKLKNQIEKLNERKVENMFHAIFQDIKDIENALESNQLHDAVDIKARLDFYDDLASTLVNEYNTEYNEIIGPIRDLISRYDNLRKQKVLNSLQESESIQKTLENINKNDSTKERFGKTKNEETGEYEDFTIEDLLVAVSDINMLDKSFLGLISSNTGDTILPQHLMQEFRQTLFRNQQSVGLMIDELNAFVERTGITDRDFLLSRDEDGNIDGFLVDVFSKKWFKKSKDLTDRIGLFFKADTTGKRRSYIQVMNWFKDNANVIDFTKLKAVSDIYSSNPEYKKYFKSSEEEMAAYEESLRQKVGPRFNSIIDTLLYKLTKFEEFKDENKGSKTYEKDVAQRNIWSFLDKYKNNSIDPIDFKYTKEGEQKFGRVYFDQFRDIPIIPRESVEDPFTNDLVDSGFYNSKFDSIKNNKDYSELWDIYRRMSEYIDSRYELEEFHKGRISYPKLEAQYAERLNESWTKLKQGGERWGTFKKMMGEFLHEYKGFFYEKGRHNPSETGVISNYSDASRTEIKKKANAYFLKGYSKEEAYKKASAEILPTYSVDLDSSFKATLLEAALHDTRMSLEKKALDILEVHKGLTDIDGKERKNSVARLEHYINKIILNRSYAERGSQSIIGKNISENSTLSRILNFLQELPFIKKWLENKSLRLLTDKEKDLLNIYKSLQGKGISEDIDNWMVDEGPYQLQVKTMEDPNYEIPTEGSEDLVIPTIKYYVANGKMVSEEEFNVVYNEYINYKIENSGLDLSLAGVIDGILKTIILKGLGLNPVSGIFNRIEGMHTVMIMDVTGEYWTPGNSDKAKSFMAFANTMKMSDKLVRGKDKERKNQLEIFEQILGKLDILQNKKNELQKSTEDDKDIAGWIYKWAVDNPEFKNQGTVILSVLMDEQIEDNNGNKVPFFDGKSFPAFELVNGVLQIKPEFSNFKFDSNQMIRLVPKLESTVAHSQGNYNAYDIMLAKKDVWGRAMMLFRTWFPEHIRQRFGVTGHDGELNIDLSHEKLVRYGRVSQAYRTSKVSFATYTAATLGISYAGLGFMGALGVGAIGAIVYNKFLKKVVNRKSIEGDASSILQLTQFLQSTLMESLNYPARLLSSVPGVNKLKFDTQGDNKLTNAYANSNLTEEEIGALRALSRELAIMLVFLSLKLAFGALAYDDDDDKESSKRKRYNFIQNQLSRTITTLGTWSDPLGLASDNAKIGAISYLDEVRMLVNHIALDPDFEKAQKHFWKITPLPNMISKSITGELPWESNMNYDEMNPTFGSGVTPLKWTSTKIKDWDTGGEYSAEKEFKEITSKKRDEIKENLMDITDNAEALEAAVNSKMKEVVGSRFKGDSYAESVRKLKEDGKLNTKEGRKTLRDKLEKMGLSKPEMQKIMYGTYSED